MTITDGQDGSRLEGEQKDEHVFPPSANGGQYSVPLSDLGAMMDVLAQVAGDESPAETVARLAAQSSRLRELATYAQHNPGCKLWIYNVRTGESYVLSEGQRALNPPMYAKHVCTCGLSTLLSTPPQGTAPAASEA